jgi:hypothetical protein
VVLVRKPMGTGTMKLTRAGMVKELHPTVNRVTVVCGYVDSARGPTLHEEFWDLADVQATMRGTKYE